MARYAFVCDYDGSAFYGWQIQPEQVSVQQTIEAALSTLCNQEIQIVGCGRTDTGVHAEHYVFHCDISGPMTYSESDLIYKANQILPETIALRQMQSVADDFHARFHAVSRSYRYLLHLGKQPLLRHTSYQYTYERNLDLKKLNELNVLFLKHQDYRYFSKTGSDNKTSICKLTEIGWTREGKQMVFSVSADRFLRGMVRILVGTYLNYHRDKLSYSDIEKALKLESNLPMVWSVPACGLHFEGARYDQIDID